MTLPNLEVLRFVNPDVRRHATEGRREQALQIASQQVSLGLCDLALAELGAGRYESAVEKLQHALNLCPENQSAFHNVAAVLLEHRQLHGNNLEALADFICRNWSALPWVRQYRQLVYMPQFINLEFVSGKCNLACRMCLGRNSPGYANRFSYMSPEDFEQMLVIAPTSRGLVLSAGDSEPLLHPRLEEIIEIARRYQTPLDFYTNGHPLGARKCRQIVESQIVQMINFSIDAATPETYRRIRGDSLERVISRIEMLQAMKREGSQIRPWVSLSFVAMKDNIPELPDFIRMAQHLGALRVLVEDLSGWGSGSDGNFLATDHPSCFEFVREARTLAASAKIKLVLPERLRERPACAGASPGPAASAEAPVSSATATVETREPLTACDNAEPAEVLQFCGWLRGVWVRMDGRLDPCCLVHGVAEMGNIKDGPLIKNVKYARVKDLLMAGKVFEECLEQRMCPYVQQRRAAGVPLHVITREELGELHPDNMRAGNTPALAAQNKHHSQVLPVATTR